MGMLSSEALVFREHSPSKSKWDGSLSLVIYGLGFLIPALLTLGRILTPDTAFDTINYHTFLGARGLNWFAFTRSEFLPLGHWSFFPGYDAVFAISRTVLGYRLGTVISLFFQTGILGLLILTHRLLNQSTGSKSLDAFLLVSAAFSLEGLFQLGTYLTDTLNGFVFLLALYFFVKATIRQNQKLYLVVSIVLALAFLGKYSNLFYVIPFFLFLLLDSIHSRRYSVCFLSVAIFFVIVSPWLINNYLESGNPFYPYFNSIFQSPFFPEAEIAGPRGNSVIERLIFPIRILGGNVRITQYFQLIPDIKFSFYLFFPLITYPTLPREAKTGTFRYLFFGFLISYFLWMYQFGYARYGIGLEYWGGVLVIACLAALRKYRSTAFKAASLWALTFLLIQNGIILAGNFKYDISWRTTLWDDPSLLSRNLHRLNDNHMELQIDGAELHLQCTFPITGYTVQSNVINLPVINTTNYSGNTPSYFKETVEKIFGLYGEKEMYRFVSIAKPSGPTPNITSCLSRLNQLDAQIDNEYNVLFLGENDIELTVITGTIDLKNLYRIPE